MREDGGRNTDVTPRFLPVVEITIASRDNGTK